MSMTPEGQSNYPFGGGGGGGALVPSVKSVPVDSVEAVSQHPARSVAVQAPEASQLATAEKVEAATATAVDKDVLCPICMQIIKDAFLTACGHSFCYMCIVTHLKNKSDCPSCSHFLTTNHLYPNFLLNKLLMKTCARQMARSATPFEQIRHAIEQTGM